MVFPWELTRQITPLWVHHSNVLKCSDVQVACVTIRGGIYFLLTYSLTSIKVIVMYLTGSEVVWSCLWAPGYKPVILSTINSPPLLQSHLLPKSILSKVTLPYTWATTKWTKTWKCYSRFCFWHTITSLIKCFLSSSPFSKEQIVLNFNVIWP